jgi:hypothetical protein
MFVLLVALMYGEKEGFESFDDQNLFLFTDLTEPNISFVRYRRHLPFPPHRVEGHRHLRQTSRFTTFYTFPDFCPRLESIQIFWFPFNNNERKHAVDAMFLCLHFRLNLYI